MLESAIHLWNCICEAGVQSCKRYVCTLLDLFGKSGEPWHLNVAHEIMAVYLSFWVCSKASVRSGMIKIQVNVLTKATTSTGTHSVSSILDYSLTKFPGSWNVANNAGMNSSRQRSTIHLSIFIWGSCCSFDHSIKANYLEFCFQQALYVNLHPPPPTPRTLSHANKRTSMHARTHTCMHTRMRTVVVKVKNSCYLLQIYHREDLPGNSTSVQSVGVTQGTCSCAPTFLHPISFWKLPLRSVCVLLCRPDYYLEQQGYTVNLIGKVRTTPCTPWSLMPKLSIHFLC